MFHPSPAIAGRRKREPTAFSPWRTGEVVLEDWLPAISDKSYRPSDP